MRLAGRWAHVMSSRSMRAIAALIAIGMGGCVRARPRFVQPHFPDDVCLLVLDLRYVPESSGYTFKYNESNENDPCDVTTQAYVRKDDMVGLLAIEPPCVGMGRGFCAIWLRRDWDAHATTEGSKEAIEKVRSIPGRRPGW